MMVILQHPIGSSDDQEAKWMAGTLGATARYRRYVLGPNGDPGREGIMRAIKQARLQGGELIDHLPRKAFLSLLKEADVLVGNSSAGLIEAAGIESASRGRGALRGTSGGLGVVNIGPRQNGREQPGHVISCAYGRRAVGKAIGLAITQPVRSKGHPYGLGDTGQKITSQLAGIRLREIPLEKMNQY